MLDKNGDDISAVHEAVFATDQTDTIYRGEAGAPSWSPSTIDVKGFGRITNLAAATANDNRQISRSAA